MSVNFEKQSIQNTNDRTYFDIIDNDFNIFNSQTKFYNMMNIKVILIIVSLFAVAQQYSLICCGNNNSVIPPNNINLKHSTSNTVYKQINYMMGSHPYSIHNQTILSKVALQNRTTIHKSNSLQLNHVFDTFFENLFNSSQV